MEIYYTITCNFCKVLYYLRVILSDNVIWVVVEHFIVHNDCLVLIILENLYRAVERVKVMKCVNSSDSDSSCLKAAYVPMEPFLIFSANSK